MSVYLRAKPWQVFVVLVGSMIFVQTIILISIVNGNAPGVLALTIPTLLIGAVYFGWLWSISAACYKALPPELASSPTPMRIGLIYVVLYLVFTVSFLHSSGGHVSSTIIAPHLLAMAAIFYSLGFTAKQLTKLERNQNVTFFSYFGPFFLFWFFPIGVWFIQPKVNRLLWQKNA